MYFREYLLHFRKQTEYGRIFEISDKGNQRHRRRNRHGNGLFPESGHFGNRSVPGAAYDSYECGDFDEYYQEVYRKVERWENCVRIDPPEPGESFGIIERFIRDCIPDDAGIKGRLWEAVSERKPFRNFKYVIDGSEYRQKWFDFRRVQLERLVADYLNSLDIDAPAE